MSGENPAIFFDYIPREFRGRISLLRDRYGEQGLTRPSTQTFDFAFQLS